MNSSTNIPLEQVLMDGIQEMVFVVRVEEGPQFYYEFINQAVINTLDFDHQVISKTFEEVLPEEMKLVLNEQYGKTLKSKEVVVFENTLDLPTKGIVYVKTTLTPLLNPDGVCTHIVEVTKNITSEKLAKEEKDKYLEQLMENKSRYRSLVDNNADAVFNIDLKGKIIHGNKTVEKVSGYLIEELIGTMFLRHTDCKSHEIEDCLQQAKDGVLNDHRINFLHKSGERIGSLIKFVPIELKNEIVGYYVILKDMRELDKMVSLYLESEKNFRIIAENVQDVIILMNHEKDYLYVSPSSKQVYDFDFDSTEIANNNAFFNIHPDDVPLLTKHFEDAIQNGKPFKVQLLAKHEKRGWIWSELSGTPVYDKSHSFQHMVMIARDISLQKQHEVELEHFAYHDSLTGLPNRRYFRNRLSKSLKILNEKGKGFALFLLDINRFKSINDQLGHESGDLVIEEFGNRLNQMIGEGDMVARLGGDEFVILLSNIETEEQVLNTVEKIVQVIERPWQIHDNVLSVTTSMGIVLALTSNVELNSSLLLKRADMSMYEAKESGGNSYRITYL